jgi:hypothetical protein
VNYILKPFTRDFYNHQNARGNKSESKERELSKNKMSTLLCCTKCTSFLYQQRIKRAHYAAFLKLYTASSVLFELGDNRSGLSAQNFP